MFTYGDMRALLQAKPFVPFRLWLSDGGFVDVHTSEVVIAGKRFALIGLLDAAAADTAFERYATVWYLHVTRHEMLTPRSAPFSSPPGQSETPVSA